MWGKLCYYEHQTENYSKFGTLDYNYQTENYSNFGTLDYINVEVPLVVWPDTSKQIKHICCGNEFTIAVTEEGVYGVGKNSEYQLGVNGASFLVDTSLRFKLIFPNDKISRLFLHICNYESNNIFNQDNTVGSRLSKPLLFGTT